MRRSLIILAGFLAAWPCAALGAISSATVWNVRTDGSSNNGGGYVTGQPGYDASDDTSAVCSSTDATCAASGTVVNLGSATCSIIGGTVGNIAYVTGAGTNWVAGYYQVVGDDGSGNITLDRTPTNGSGNATGGAIYIGGASSDPAGPIGAAVAGNTINIKAGTYTLSASLSPSNAGGNTGRITVRGYTASYGDAIAPVATFDANDGNYVILNQTQPSWDWMYVTFSNNDTQSQDGVSLASAAYNNLFYRCRFSAIGNSAVASTPIIYGTLLVECEIDNWAKQTATDYGIELGRNGVVVGCYLRNGGRGVLDGAGIGNYVNSTIFANLTGEGVYQVANAAGLGSNINGCVFYSLGSDGVWNSGAGTTPASKVLNCLFVSCTGYGISASSTTDYVVGNCGFYNNSAGTLSTNINATLIGQGVIALAADPFVDAFHGDFRLRPDQGTLLGNGIPETFIGGGAIAAWGNGPDIGAVQQPIRPIVNRWLGGG